MNILGYFVSISLSMLALIALSTQATIENLIVKAGYTMDEIFIPAGIILFMMITLIWGLKGER